MNRRLWWIGLGIALFLAGVVSFYASAFPDGLEHVAASIGFENAAHEQAAPLAGYTVQGIASDRLSGGLAGVIGCLVVLGISYGVFRLVPARKATSGHPHT